MNDFPYITNLRYRDIGPLAAVDIAPRFDAQGNPVPILIVGENGSGKSILLSNVVDSFYEIAGVAFHNAKHLTDAASQEYFKVISGDQIRSGQDHLYVRLRFANGKGYVFVAGRVRFDEAKQDDPLLTDGLQWSTDEGTFKKTDFSKKQAEDIFQGNAVCYFGPSRYERPDWLGGSYDPADSQSLSLSIDKRFAGQLATPISVGHCADKTTQWLLNVIADARVDVSRSETDSLILAHPGDPGVGDAVASERAKLNVERIMSLILGEQVYFSLGNRGLRGQRLRLRSCVDDSVVVSSLGALSTGQVALFELFATIIRYADMHDANKPLDLSGVRGIVVIDEADLHLHVEMQHKVLPSLIRLFPGVQFLISTHSPMFVLGMQDAFGPTGFDTFSLPDGDRIESESFSQFDVAYQYFQNTERYRKSIAEAIEHASVGKPLIISEGTTDWRHMKAARSCLSKRSDCQGLFEHEFEFFEFGPKGDARCAACCEMGGDELAKLCERYSLVGAGRPLVFIADRDKVDVLKKVGGKGVKEWGNDVFSFALPVPDFRADDPCICIEQMYADDVIRTPVERAGVMRRLFLKSEFSKTGDTVDGCYLLGSKKLLDGKGSSIIDSSKATISKIGSDENYALSKVEFANAVLDETIDLPEDVFDSFIPLFEMIREAIGKASALGPAFSEATLEADESSET